MGANPIVRAIYAKALEEFHAGAKILAQFPSCDCKRVGCSVETIRTEAVRVAAAFATMTETIAAEDAAQAAQAAPKEVPLSDVLDRLAQLGKPRGPS